MIYHVVDRAQWASRSEDEYVATVGPEGFVHCCDERQLEFVRRNYFPANVAVIALEIDPTRLNVETRYEPGAGGETERFPHVYGPIPRSVVRAMRDI